MIHTVKQRDLEEFFRFVYDPARTVRSVIVAYTQYHGDINWHQQQILVAELNRLCGPGVPDLEREDVLGVNGELTQAFLAAHAPDFAQAYFSAAAPPDLRGDEILPASANEWCDTALPKPMNMRLGLPRRPAFRIYQAQGRQLFAAPYGYQAFDEAAGTYWPSASSRAFGRGVAAYPRLRVEQPLVIVQDQYDGGNFSHFLADWLPRVLYFAMLHPEQARQCVYLMGGAPGPLHHLAFSLVQEQLGIPAAHFVFPQERIVLELQSNVLFFSDQREAITHPLHMAHPATVRLVRDLFRTIAMDASGPVQIYISRRDAGLRRVVNEAALVEALTGRGFVDLQLSDFDITRQMALVSNARCIVAPHGMGLAHIMFHRRIGSVVEMFNPEIGSDAYAFIARALGLQYRFVVGHDVDDGKAGYTIDVERVLDCLDR
jgi:hypothetical protein